MKRGRGAYKICALVKSGDLEKLSHLVMRESGTLGVRHHPVGRVVAERRIETVSLPYGECRVKIGSLDGEDFTVSPEYADAANLAKKENLPLPKVYADARSAADEKLKAGSFRPGLRTSDFRFGP
jgi:pyridinium-3,5-bisthiocarboxylic acid mononucleotide nickel chelatase